MAGAVIVVPTYNEKDNLPSLIGKIFDLKLPELKVVVVDDNSPDGTGNIADSLAQTYPIKVIHRHEKLGLAIAYVRAFKEILKETDADYIFEMDADLSHDPAAVPQFLEKIKNCDLVLGSRYIAGGRIENWDFVRRLVSRAGNFYARLVLNLPYRDLTGGYKCYRRKVLEALNFDALSSVGYNFQIETTYLAYKKGFKICEIPITFTERKSGVSKFNLWIILESFRRVLLLRFQR